MKTVGGHGDKSRKQDEAIAALLTYPTLREAAAAAHIGLTTLVRMMERPDFDAAYKQARKQVISAAVGRLQALVGTAVETLNEIMIDTDAPTSSRVASARAVLEMAGKFIETEIIIERLERVEQQIEGGRRSA